MEIINCNIWCKKVIFTGNTPWNITWNITLQNTIFLFILKKFLNGIFWIKQFNTIKYDNYKLIKNFINLLGQSEVIFQKIEYSHVIFYIIFWVKYSTLIIRILPFWKMKYSTSNENTDMTSKNTKTSYWKKW